MKSILHAPKASGVQSHFKKKDAIGLEFQILYLTSTDGIPATWSDAIKRRASLVGWLR
jgi:hypothetical protein